MVLIFSQLFQRADAAELKALKGNESLPRLEALRRCERTKTRFGSYNGRRLEDVGWGWTFRNDSSSSSSSSDLEVGVVVVFAW